MTPAEIPSMGGREIGAYLRAWAAAMPNGYAIIELGCWLGAGTAQMLAGIRDSGRDVELHAYDNFQAHKSEITKARAQGVELKAKQDTLPLVRSWLGEDVHLHKSDIRCARWSGRLIGLYVDDACKREAAFLSAIRTFAPYWAPGQTVVVLMDYWYFQRKTDPALRFQYEWMQAHRSSFRLLREHMPPTTAAAWRYLGP